jgi:hypothetical protein
LHAVTYIEAMFKEGLHSFLLTQYTNGMQVIRYSNILRELIQRVQYRRMAFKINAIKSLV